MEKIGDMPMNRANNALLSRRSFRWQAFPTPHAPFRLRSFAGFSFCASLASACCLTHALKEVPSSNRTWNNRLRCSLPISTFTRTNSSFTGSPPFPCFTYKHIYTGKGCKGGGFRILHPYAGASPLLAGSVGRGGLRHGTPPSVPDG